MKKKMLFVSHDASRTGAPMVLKHLLQWLKKSNDVEITILIKDGGDIDIEDGFKAIAPVYKWAPNTPREGFTARMLSKITNKLFKKPLYKSYPSQLKNQQFDLVYFNTVASTVLIPHLKLYHTCPFLLHVHENAFSIKTYYPDSLNPAYTKLIDHYIAVSNSTKQNLVENFNIPPEKVSVVNAFVPVKNFASPAIEAAVIKEELKIKDEFVVGGAGVTSWRKGIDIFIEVALIITKTLGSGKIKFVWVGYKEHLFTQQADYELTRRKEAEITFTGAVSNPQDYFQVFDVFALTSREDPFPLVCLETAALAKPIICFDRSGGMPDLLANGGGIVVPYADAQAMADAIIELYNNRERVTQLGSEAQAIVQQFDVAVQAPLVLDVIDRVSASKT